MDETVVPGSRNTVTAGDKHSTAVRSGGAHPLEVPRYQTMTRRNYGRIRKLQAPIKAAEPTISTFQHCPPAAVAL